MSFFRVLCIVEAISAGGDFSLNDSRTVIITLRHRYRVNDFSMYAFWRGNA